MSHETNDPSSRSSHRAPSARRHSSILRGPKGRLFRLCQKELRETLRDRRTIITLVLMPLLVYPLLSMAFNRFLISATVGASEETPYIIGVASDIEGETLLAWLEDSRSQPPNAILKASNGTLAKFDAVNTMSDGITPEEAKSDGMNREEALFDGMTPEEALKLNRIDLAASITFGEPHRVHLTAYNGDMASQSAQRILTERLHWLLLSNAESFAGARDSEYAPPVEVTVNRVGTIEKPSMLGTIVPLVLVLMTITGAVYPAIDLTAGERERGTMESLMASPVPRSYILFSKYIAVVVVALLTAVANLLAMFTTLWAGRLLPLLTGNEAFPWLAVLQILGLLVLFSGFFSAVLLSLTSFARSFKEAQAYLIPIMLLSLTPGMLSLMPGVNLSGPLVIAPLINIVLLAREVLQGTAQAAPAAMTILSTFGYAAAALAVASKLFGSDAVSRTSGQSFAAMLKRPNESADSPNPQTAAMTLALLVPIYYLVSNLLMRFATDIPIGWRLAVNALALLLTFGLIPLAATILGRCRLPTTYRLALPGPTAVMGAIFIGLGSWGFAHEFFVIADQMGLGGLDTEKIAKAKEAVELLKLAPAWLLLGSLALAPAVIEELCFRGFLFSALRNVLSPVKLILTTAVIFGLFHVVTGNVLLIERFIPTTFLGIILGWIAYRTGSVWPGVMMHFTHNGLINLALKYKDQLAFLGEGSEEQAHLPATWLALLSTLTFAGIAIVWLGSRQTAPRPTKSPED